MSLKRKIRTLLGFSAILMLFSASFSKPMNPTHVLFEEKSALKQKDKEQRTIIRVAFPTQEGRSFFGHSGKVTGYNYDYLEKISEYTGWQMEYVPYGSSDGNEAVGKALSDLKEGKVDLLGPLLKNSGTEKNFEFPQRSYGTVYTTLCALKTNGLREHNLYGQALIKVGLWESAATRNGEVLSYLDSEKLNYEIVYYKTADEQKQALIDGKVDVISSVSLSPIANTRIVANFAPRPYYFASTKGNTGLIQKLDEARKRIDEVNPNFQDTLYDTYFRVANNTFLLSDEREKELSNIGKLKVLCRENTAPYAYEDNGKPKGVLVSALDDYCQRTGIKTEYTFASDRTDAEGKLDSGEFAFFLGRNMTSSRCSKFGYINSAPILTSVLSFAQRPDSDGKASRIAIVRGREEQYSTSDYEEVILCDNSRACLQAVEKGKADIAFGTRDSRQYYIYETGSSLVTSLVPGQTVNVTIPVSRDINTNVLASLNSYVASISESDLSKYISEANIHKNSGSLLLFRKRNPLQAAAILASVLILIAGIVIFFIVYYSKQKNKLEKVHNEQLSEALQVAEEANKAKTTFLSNRSHDIRTPRNAVIGFSTLLSKNTGDETKVKEYSRKITAASNHLLGLINDILDISKIESGKRTIRQSAFSLDELIESVNVVIRPMANAKKQELRINVGVRSHELFMGDKTRINQILINLLSNSIKYTPEGGQIGLQITDLGQSSQSFERLRFVVTDNGYGISDEFKKIIFDPFTRAENSTTNKESGTGLGLAITKNIIDLRGGTIDLQSELGKGTTFTVELSLHLTHEEEDKDFWHNHHRSRILLVDDEKSVCDGIKENRSDTGVVFDAVYSGKAAVELVKERYAEKKEYNAVILDWQMPGRNGLDTAKEIRKIIPVDTPILFLTSYDWTDIETKALEIDIDGFLAKPFSEVNLKEKLIEVERFKNSVSEDDTVFDLKGRHFLIAEDNDLNAEIALELLKSEGATADVAKDGKQVVEKFLSSKKGTYNAILRDVRRPGRNGYEATKAIRDSNHPEAKEIPIIARTASAFVKDVQDALDAGRNAHIAKPIHRDVLKNTLNSCLKKKSVEGGQEDD